MKNAVAIFVANHFPQNTTKAREVARLAVGAIDAAIARGGAPAVERLATLGWPESRVLDLGPILSGPSADRALRAAIRYAARLEVARETRTRLFPKLAAQ